MSNRQKITRFDSAVQIQQTTEAIDGAGQPTHTWATVRRMKARVVDMSSRERYLAQQQDIVATAKVTLRERYAGLRAGDRIYMDQGDITRTLEIVSKTDAEPRDRSHGHVLLCLEVLA